MTHLGWPYDLMTLPEFEGLPEDNSRLYELQDGVLVTSPTPEVLHQRVTLEARLDRFTAEQVLLAVEIVSEGSRTTDTVVKPVEYAEAGIPHYWTVDLNGPMSVTAYRRGDNGQYQKGPATSGVLSVADPFPLSLDLTELTSPRKKVDR